MAEFYASPTDVRQLLEREEWPTTGLTDGEIQSWLDDANMLVVEELEEYDMSDRRLTKIEARLAGHYVLASGIDDLRQTAQRTSSDGASERYDQASGEGLRSTTLGQQAIEMDTSGTLASIADESEDLFFRSM